MLRYSSLALHQSTMTAANLLSHRRCEFCGLWRQHCQWRGTGGVPAENPRVGRRSRREWRGNIPPVARPAPPTHTNFSCVYPIPRLRWPIHNQALPIGPSPLRRIYDAWRQKRLSWCRRGRDKRKISYPASLFWDGNVGAGTMDARISAHRFSLEANCREHGGSRLSILGSV